MKKKIQYCKCSHACTAIVKTYGKLYARGHSPDSHSEERNAKARKVIQDMCDAGTIKRLYGDDNVSRRPEVRQKIKDALTGVPKSENAKDKMSVYRKAHLQTEHLGLPMSRPHSDETKAKISNALKGKTKNYAVWNKGKPGTQVAWNKGLTKHTDERVAKYAKSLEGHPLTFGTFKYKDTYMRSSWEVIYAKYLDSHRWKWAYEPTKFYVGPGPWVGVYYYPDFYIKKQNLYVEVKGAWLNGSYEKMQAFRKQYPEIKLLVVTERVFLDILHVSPRAA
jgi:ribosomal protein S19E (S16A)